jgi:hypothetical protein
VWDPEAEVIIGGYRYLLGPEVKVDDKGQPILATSHMFHFSERFIKDYLPYTIELGRSWVTLEYQSTRAGSKGLFALDNLWDGLGALTVVLPNVRYLFGKMTMYPSYDKMARDMILFFLKKHFGDPDKLIIPMKPLEIEADQKQLEALFCEEDFRADYRILNREVRNLGYNIPPLVNAYMNLSPTMRMFGTAINYGETATFMGVYEPENRDYRQDIIFTEYAYGLHYHGSLTIPLLAILPKSDWTKIILKGTGEYTYSGYTGAKDGEVWKAGAQNLVNGFRYKYGGTLIYMLPFARVPMVMFAATVSGFKHEYDFDDTYKDYNPGFKTVNLTPMASVKINDEWNGMLMLAISRDRKFENRRYPTTEELLQKQVGAEWDLRTVMFIASRKF